MSFAVTFEIADDTDGNGIPDRTTKRTWINNRTTLADLATDLAAFGPLLQDLIEGGVVSISARYEDTVNLFAPNSQCNKDEGISVRTLDTDGNGYTFKIPTPKFVYRLPGGAIDTTHSSFAFFDQFLTAGHWRVNAAHPVAITGVVSATLDEK